MEPFQAYQPGYTPYGNPQSNSGYYNQPYYNGNSQLGYANNPPAVNNSYQNYVHPSQIGHSQPQYNVRFNDHTVIPQQVKRIWLIHMDIFLILSFMF